MIVQGAGTGLVVADSGVRRIREPIVSTGNHSSRRNSDAVPAGDNRGAGIDGIEERAGSAGVVAVDSDFNITGAGG